MELSPTDLALRRHCDGRLMGLRTNRYSWWVHWRELADYILPRRYRWFISPNQQSRGSPINQAIIDDSGTLAARNLASGINSGVSPQDAPWFRLKIGRIDSAQTSPISLWLAECERLMALVFQESNFYNAIAVLYFDLVVFGTAVMLIYEDYDNVIHCYNPCLGEYYLDNDDKFRPLIFYREFTLTIAQCVEKFGYDSCSESTRRAFDQPDGGALARELVVAHAIELNESASKYGFPSHFAFREMYWEYQGSNAPQGSGSTARGFLRKRGFNEAPHIAVRWDLVSNDAYGRSPGMDALGDIKQLQQEVRRKAQAIDKMVNPPLVADIQLKNQPASLTPGGVTYVSGFAQSGKPGFSSVYDTKFPVGEITEDLNECRERIRKAFFNDLFQTASQYETRSNVTAVEWDMRKSESLVMLGPVLDRIQYEGLKPIIERTWACMSRAGILPDPPAEIAGKELTIEYVSMLTTAQAAAKSVGIERVMAMAGNLAGVDPAVMDNIDIDMAIDIYSDLLNNDPRIIRSPDALAMIRQQRAQAQQAQQQAEMAEKLAAGAKTLSETNIGGGANALQQMTGRA